MAVEEKTAAGKLEDAKRSLWKDASGGFFRVIDKAPASWKSADARFYRMEQRILQEHLSGIYWGAFAGVLFFATLRISGSQWLTRFRGTYLDVPKKQVLEANPMHQQKKQWKSHLDKQTEKQEEYAKDILKLPSDAFIGIMCGLSSILWLSKPTQFCKDVAEAPLLPGKSVIYEFVCPEMESTFQRVVSDDILEEAGADKTLQAFGVFVYNCRQRSKYLENQEDAPGKNRGVVPYPGLEGRQLS